MKDEIKKPSLLIVEDESALRLLMSEVLSEGGYAVDVAENGREALQKLNKESYNIIISDVAMPEMDGITLYRAIAESLPEVKNRVLFVTGNPSEEAKSFFEQNGCKYITKPFRTADLLAHINSILSKFNPASRSEPRFHWSAYCRILEEGPGNITSVTAKTEDISKNGIRIRYVGGPLQTGRLVNIHIMSLDLRRPAKIVWSKAANEIDFMAGLQLVESMPLPAAVSATLA
ncbi:MAG: response regulator [Deltaproteobacteria bacterium]|nr:response regulator [Deltaproteobacteria bacterium]